MASVRFVAPLLLAGMVALSGCESSEERAERYYQTALASLAEGRVDSALISLRQVFDFDGFHKDARALYAQILREQGQVREAYGQYLRLIEQYPDTLDARLALTEIALSNRDGEEIERHGQAAVDLAPEDPRVASIVVLLEALDAVQQSNTDALGPLADRARVVLATAPDDQIARWVVMQDLLSSETPEQALPELERLIEQTPENLALYLTKRDLLIQANDLTGLQAHLETAVDLFPEQESFQDDLLRVYGMSQDVDGAEALLRKLAERRPDRTEGHERVVTFLTQARGPEAALAEIHRLVAAYDGAPATDLYRALAEGMRFASGEPDAAIAGMRAILETAEPSDQTRRIAMMLVRMLSLTDAVDEAMTLVDRVIAEDATHVAALKLRAARAIEDDRVGEAITDLRAASTQAPQDPELLTLMAEAYLRDGNRELAGDRLSLAVDATNGRPTEAIRYARFLMADGRLGPARSMLETSLRNHPNDLALFRLLADIALSEEDWAQVRTLVERLDNIADPAAAALAEGLRTAALLGENQLPEVTAQLERQRAAGGEAGRRATVLMAMVQARDGDMPGARETLRAALEETPEDLSLRMLDVEFDIATADVASAEAKLRAILADNPGATAPVRQLYDLLQQQGETQRADALIDEQLALAPQSRFLRLVKGAALHSAGDIDGSIAVFEALYRENTADTVIANNLATLIATHRSDDAEAVARAFSIAGRLRGSDNPAFQDTYGWIEFLRGNLEDALRYLEPAARGLPNDPLVQYHLAMAYDAAERHDEARVQFERALALAEGTALADLPQFDNARTWLQTRSGN